MKKLLALALTLMMTLSFTAALADNTLTMATNASFPPYEYYEGEAIVGIDVEICAAIAAKLGMEFEVADMDFDAIIGAVQSGKADVGMAGMTVTEERAMMINFSSSYATGIQSVIVKEDSPITTVDDLYAEGASYKIGVQLSTTGDIYATDDFGDENVLRFPNGNDATMALVAGKIDCVIIDNEPAKAYVASNAGLKVLDTSYAVEDYAACIAKNNTELLEKFDAALTELIADGTVAEIIGKYIKAE
ncbi:MAG: ABC transporter substrate-binding protein [bacterium]|nr:ABC transporter substrate-binding protein [bacterium]